MTLSVAELPEQEREAPKLRDRVDLEVANLKEATEVIVKNHYLHRGRTMAQLPYWINLDGERSGVLLFALPRFSVEYQGYGPMNLLELARMWLNPKVQGMRVTDSDGNEHAFSVASCAVGAALRRVRQDWYGKYPHLPYPLAVVSWADDVHHEGTIYRATNFREVGKSGGSFHGNGSRPNGGQNQLNEDYLHVKTAFLYEYAKPLGLSELKQAYEEWEGRRTPTVRKRLEEDGPRHESGELPSQIAQAVTTLD